MAGSTLRWEILVVDNGSTDGSRELLKKKYTRVTTLFNKDNVGFGKANNQGMKKAKGGFILLLNSDTEAIDDALPRLYEFAKSHPKSFVGGKLLNADGSDQSSCGPAFSLPIVALMLFAKGDTIGITRYSPNTIKHVYWVSGACIIATKKAFADAGFFDEDIFMYMEEIELLARAHKHGYTVMFYPDARFFHVGAASSGSRKTPVLNIYRGLLYFYSRHRSIMDQKVLRVLLALKAHLAVFVGRLSGKASLVSIYEEAIKLV